LYPYFLNDCETADEVQAFRRHEIVSSVASHSGISGIPVS
jgi:hypothetical protein